jgi:hypothetical protein
MNLLAIVSTHWGSYVIANRRCVDGGDKAPRSVVGQQLVDQLLVDSQWDFHSPLLPTAVYTVLFKPSSFVPDPEQRLWRTITRRKLQITRLHVRMQEPLGDRGLILACSSE